MPFERLPDTTQTLLAELRELVIHGEAEAASLALPAGGFVSKTIRGAVYWYLQQVNPPSRRQIYLGRESPELRDWMDCVRAARDRLQADVSDRERLCRMAIAGGAATDSAGILRVLDLLADAGVFRRGAVLVGTQAFSLLGNLLGVRFDPREMRTQDVDVAQDRTLGIALAAGEEPADLDARLTGAELGFFGVPGLHRRRPSTSYKVRGRELRVDFLTPLVGRETGEPVFLPSLGVDAVPLRLLGYLLEGTVQAVAVGRGGVLVNVPDAARFALHKLWLAGQRGLGEQAKAAKDLRQGGAILEVLLADRPGDLAPAWEALRSHGAAVVKVFERSLGRLPEELARGFEAHRSAE